MFSSQGTNVHDQKHDDASATSPLIFFPEKRILDPLDPDDPKLGLGDRLVEKAVDGPVAPVLPGHRHLQEVLVHGHGQPRLWEKAGGVGGCW